MCLHLNNDLISTAFMFPVSFQKTTADAGEKALVGIMEWTMNEVSRWLKDIGLSKYTTRFQSHLITGPVLLGLDDSLLDDLNIMEPCDRQDFLLQSAKLRPQDTTNISSRSTTKKLEIRTLENPIITVGCIDDAGEYNEHAPVMYEDDETTGSMCSSDEEVDELEDFSSTDDDHEEEEQPQHKQQQQQQPQLQEERGIYNNKYTSTVDTTLKTNITKPNLVLQWDMNERNKEASIVATRATQMVRILSQENVSLRDELDSCYTKIEDNKMVQEELHLTSKKRENLESNMRARLESEISQIHENNKQLRDELQNCSKELAHLRRDSLDGKCRKKLETQELDVKTKNIVLVQLIAQNQQGALLRDQLEKALKKERKTVVELRTENGRLRSVSQNDSNKNEDISRRIAYPYRINELQTTRTLYYKRRTSSKSNGSSTEDDSANAEFSADEGIAELDGPSSIPVLLQILRGKEQRIQALERELVAQRLLHERTSRQLAVNVASTPKAARVAALERTVQESGKILADCRAQNLKYIEELYVANRRCADLEAVITSLHSQLAERNAHFRAPRLDGGNADEPKDPEWPSVPIFSRTDLSQAKELARDLAEVESLDSGMSVSNMYTGGNTRTMCAHTKELDEPDQVSVHFWCV